MYQKAEEILPPILLEEIQKYCHGTILYVPKKTERAAWGSKSGSRIIIDNRNNEIVNQFNQGKNVEEIAIEFHLSTSAIKKIVYSKK